MNVYASHLSFRRCCNLAENPIAVSITFKSCPQLPTSSRPNMSAGFTLIELLIVLLILSITFGFAVFSFGDFGKSRETQMHAEQLQSLIRHVREQAILEAHDYTVQITKTGFRTFKQNNAGSFELHEHPQSTSGTFPSGINVTPNLNIRIHASGEITAFTLNFGTSSNPKVVILIGKTNGQLTLVTP